MPRIPLDQIFQSAPTMCPYIQDRVSRSVGFLADTLSKRDVAVHCIQRGYRRSGLFVYRPHCPRCARCFPVRIRIDRFTPNRTQRRIASKHRDRFSVRVSAPYFNEAHFALYSRYLALRHSESDMARQNDATQYRRFIVQSPLTSYLCAFSPVDRLGDTRLLSLLDELDDGLSAVYTAYDPDSPKDSLGVFSILWQIELARSLDKTYLYLGYYIPGCPGMDYKGRFSGLEVFVDETWRPIDAVDLEDDA